MLEIRLEDLKDDHIRRSKSMILNTAKLAGRGAAAVLGCGSCTEIPLGEMLDIFDPVDLVELDRKALSAIQRKHDLSDDAQRRLRVHNRDLTGIMAHLEREKGTICSAFDTPSSLLEKLGNFLAAVEPCFWAPAGGGKIDLIVCSAVLTQLQATVRRKAEEMFVDRFPDAAALLRSNKTWKKKLWVFARKLETAFIAHLDSLVTSGGLIYLSDTVHVCWLQETGDGKLATPGAWIATKSAELSDYLAEHHAILLRDAWQWLRWGNEGDYCGRLYGVQAIAYGHERL